MFSLTSRVNRPIMSLCTLVLMCGGCVQTEQVPFDIQLSQQACTDQHGDLSRVLVMLIPIVSDGSLCLLQSSSMTPGERASSLLEGGVLDNDEVVLAALAYAEDCIRCQALARVSLQDQLIKYTLDLKPTEECGVPQAALEGLGLPLTELPPRVCAP